MLNYIKTHLNEQISVRFQIRKQSPLLPLKVADLNILLSWFPQVLEIIESFWKFQGIVKVFENRNK